MFGKTRVRVRSTLVAIQFLMNLDCQVSQIAEPFSLALMQPSQPQSYFRNFKALAYSCASFYDALLTLATVFLESSISDHGFLGLDEKEKGMGGWYGA